MTSNHS